MGPVVANIRQRLITVRNHGRALVRAHRSHHIDPVRNPVGVGDHYLLRLLSSQIGKFLQHLLCGAQVKRGLIVCIRKMLARHDNPPIDLILRL